MVREAGKKRLLQLQQIFLQNKGLHRLYNSKLTIPAIVFVAFFILSLGIGGPAYLSDEIGYLDKAATIAGSTVHAATSWYAGYSFMISPAFFLSTNPHVEWNIVLILNALMWAASAALLQYILKQTHPTASRRAIFFATLGAMLYPSWLSMSGYAFATSGFVVVLMACLAALLKSKLRDARWLSAAALCAGYLAWIHPLGFIFLGLFVAVLLLKAFVQRDRKLALVSLIPLAVAGTYLAIVQPWLHHVMSGSLANNDDHYAAGVSAILHALFTPQYWLQAGIALSGLLFFTLIATFGLVIYGSVDIVRRLGQSRKIGQQLLDSPQLLVMILSLAAVIGVTCFTALSWAGSKQLRPDQWIYGRYTDMYLLPLLGFGLLAVWQSKQAFKIALGVVMIGILLSLMTNPNNTDYAYINKVNLQAFWPIHLPQAIRTNNYWAWGVLGAVGIAVCGYMGTARRKLYLILLLFPIMLAGSGNYLYQFRIAHGYSSPSSLYQYVQTHYTTSDCIGFTTDGDKDERFNLYSYYLHGYNLKRMTLEQWQQQACQGPYFTYDSMPAVAPTLQIKGIEAKTNLYMITRTNGVIARDANDETPVFYKNELIGYAVVFR